MFSKPVGGTDFTCDVCLSVAMTTGMWHHRNAKDKSPSTRESGSVASVGRDTGPGRPHWVPTGTLPLHFFLVKSNRVSEVVCISSDKDTKRFTERYIFWHPLAEFTFLLTPELFIVRILLYAEKTTGKSQQETSTIFQILLLKVSNASHDSLLTRLTMN